MRLNQSFTIKWRSFQFYVSVVHGYLNETMLAHHLSFKILAGKSLFEGGGRLPIVQRCHLTEEKIDVHIDIFTGVEGCPKTKSKSRREPGKLLQNLRLS